MSQYQKELDVATKAAKAAGEVMRKYLYADQEQETKDDGTPVTIADTTINSQVIKLLAEHFPDDIVIGEEESTGEYGMGRRWFCDPIDGTNSFTWGVPTAMFSLALAIDGKPVLGLAYDPWQDLLFTGVIGEGSTVNGQPLQVSDKNFSNGIATFPADIKFLMSRPSYVEAVVDKGATIALFGGAVFRGVLIARGKLVSFASDKLNAHDVAAIQVVIEEAGGRLTGWDGQPIDYSRPFKGAIMTNGVVHDELVDLIAK